MWQEQVCRLHWLLSVHELFVQLQKLYHWLPDQTAAQKNTICMREITPADFKNEAFLTL